MHVPHGTNITVTWHSQARPVKGNLAQYWDWNWLKVIYVIQYALFGYNLYLYSFEALFAYIPDAYSPALI